MERLLSSILELIEASEVPENVQITFIRCFIFRSNLNYKAYVKILD